MNSTLKRAVTTGAALILLTGATGTLAGCRPDLGSDSGSSSETDAGTGGAGAGTGGGAGAGSGGVPGTGVGGGGIDTGTLSLDRLGAPRWTDQNGPIDIAAFSAIPGDVLTYSTDYRIGARGTGLRATLAAENVTVTGNGALKDAMIPVVTYTVDGNPLPANGTGALVTSDLDGGTVTVSVTFTFPRSSDDPAAQQQSINLSRFNVTLKQV